MIALLPRDRAETVRGLIGTPEGGQDLLELTHQRAAGVSVVVDVSGGGLPRILHWGADLGELDEAGLAALRAVRRPAPIGFPVDGASDVAVLPEQSAGRLGGTGPVGDRSGRDCSARFQVVRVDGGMVRAEDAQAGLALDLVLELTPSGLVRQRATVTNLGATPSTVDAVTLTLPVPPQAVELLDFTGHHLRERSPQRLPWVHGSHVRENRRGRTGFDAAYLMAAGTAGFGNRGGEVWAVHTAWSGNHRTYAERNFHSVALLGSGELLLSGEVVLDPGGSYTSPWQYGSYGVGLDEVSARFHRYLRARPHHPVSPRPVVVNTWEAVYFDHDLDRLRALADAAAAVGAERFVLDDGWFGGRRDDHRGLGDWYVSDEVWPDGLGPLVDHVTGLGLQFGLWVEPEMINEDSELARAHPDWIMSAGGRLPGQARWQQVLDLANPAAYAHILDRLDALLRGYRIGYLKWDHNRDLVEAGHPPTGRAGVHDQTLAVYRLLDELRARHPGLEIESCSSGGARVDLGILAHTDRVWASDTNDAVERQRIQRWMGLLVPPELIGSHVGPPEAHTTGRVTTLGMRTVTALFGHAGLEWDVPTCTDEEVERLRAWALLDRQVRGLLHSGDVVRAD